MLTLSNPLSLVTEFGDKTLSYFLESIVQAGIDGKVRVQVAGAASAGRLIHFLTSIPKSSNSFLDGHSSYAYGSTKMHLQGRELGSATGSLNGAGLANVAYLRGQEACENDPAHQAYIPKVLGLGVSAAFASGGRRGGDRIRIAIRTIDSFKEALINFPKGSDAESRSRQHDYADLLMLNAILATAGLEQICFDCSELEAEVGVLKNGNLELADVARPKVSTRGTLNVDDALFIDIDGTAKLLEKDSISPEKHVIYPGSFRRFHFGHDCAASAAQLQTDKQVVFEITSNNADPSKPHVSLQDLVQRSLQFRGRWPVILRFGCGKFVEKAKAYGGVDFVVGFDTAIRMVDKAFYNDSWQEASDSLDFLMRTGCRFHVLGRKTDHGFETADDISCKRKHHGLFHHLAGQADISATQLVDAS